MSTSLHVYLLRGNSIFYLELIPYVLYLFKKLYNIYIFLIKYLLFSMHNVVHLKARKVSIWFSFTYGYFNHQIYKKEEIK